MKITLLITLIGAPCWLPAEASKARRLSRQLSRTRWLKQAPNSLLRLPRRLTRRGSPLSAGAMMGYAASEDLFHLRVPSGWSMQKDTHAFENTVV